MFVGGLRKVRDAFIASGSGSEQFVSWASAGKWLLNVHAFMCFLGTQHKLYSLHGNYGSLHVTCEY